jgi:hypothetical protein
MSSSGLPPGKASGSTAGSASDPSHTPATASVGSEATRPKCVSPCPPPLPLQQGDVSRRLMPGTGHAQSQSLSAGLESRESHAAKALGGSLKKNKHVDPTPDPRLPPTATGGDETATAAGVPKQPSTTGRQEAVTTQQAVTASAPVGPSGPPTVPAAVVDPNDLVFLLPDVESADGPHASGINPEDAFPKANIAVTRQPEAVGAAAAEAIAKAAMETMTFMETTTSVEGLPVGWSPGGCGPPA